MFQAMEGRLKASARLPRFRVSRRSWPAFLNSLLPASVWQNLSNHDPRRADARIRWRLKYILLAWIVMGWSIQSQALARFGEARDILARLHPRRRRPGNHYQGLIKASSRWATLALRELWKHLRPTLARRAADAWATSGWTVLAVDGSRFDAPRTQSNERSLGLAGRQKTHPQWIATLLIHLPTGLLWDWRHGPATDSERGHLRDMLDDVPPNALLLADAGFTGYDLMWELHGRGLTFVIRCGSNVTLLVEGTRQKILRRCGQHDVYLWPGKHQKQRASMPMCLRLLTVKQRGRPVYLLTNELDSMRLPRSTAAALYRLRWGIEIGYRELKQTLDRRKLRACSAGVGELELSATILAWALLRLQACVLMGNRMTRVSMASVVRVIRGILEAVRFARTTRWFFAGIRQSVRDDYRRRRSKKARNWPHKKNEPPAGAPQLRGLRPRQIASIQALAAIADTI